MTRDWKGESFLNVRLVPPWSWVSYLGCVAGVLGSRRVKTDVTQVAGMSGYAFLLNVHRSLSASGPTAFDWTMLEEGTQSLGVETEVVVVDHDPESEREFLAAELFERVRQEIDQGRCCIVWGATSAPEFAIVYGYRDDRYVVRSLRSVVGRDEQGLEKDMGPLEAPEDPVPYDQLQAPGCVGGVFFGDEIEVDVAKAGRQALARAVQLLSDRATCFDPNYVHGLGAFGAWADALAGGEAEGFGNSHNVHCYWELQLMASGFCRRMSGSMPRAKQQLLDASRAFGDSAQSLERMKRLFPFPKGGDLSDATTVEEARDLLTRCRDLNQEALTSLQEALGLI